MTITITPVSLEGPRQPTPGLPAFYVAIAVVFFAVSSCIGLVLWFQKTSLGNDLNELSIAVRELRGERAELESSASKLNRLALQLSSLNEFVNNHQRGANALLVVEEKTHPEVRIESIVVNYPARSIDLAAVGRSVRSVAEQVYLLEQNAHLIERVVASGFHILPNGEVWFSLVLTPRPQLFTLTEPGLSDFISGSSISASP